jgi:hypothetical protein
MLKKMTRRFGYSILALTSLWIGVAAVLVFSPGPRFVHPAVASSVTDSHIATAALAPAHSRGPQQRPRLFGHMLTTPSAHWR